MCFFKSKNKTVDAYGETFALGDMVCGNGKYKNVDARFDKPLKVVRVRATHDIKYCGYQFVFVIMDGEEHGFYSNGLKKV